MKINTHVMLMALFLGLLDSPVLYALENVLMQIEDNGNGSPIDGDAGSFYPGYDNWIRVRTFGGEFKQGSCSDFVITKEIDIASVPLLATASNLFVIPTITIVGLGPDPDSGTTSEKYRVDLLNAKISSVAIEGEGPVSTEKLTLATEKIVLATDGAVIDTEVSCGKTK
jgi:type VI protein secretion system component Hcp